MKRILPVFMTVLAGMILGGCGAENPGKTKLEALIRDELGKPAGELTDVDFQMFQEFSFYPDSDNQRTEEEKIEDITLIGKMTELKKLNLGANNIEDISALSSLGNVEELTLSGNRIKDIKVLGGMSKLTKVELDQNKIADISALAGLSSLRIASLSKNNIKDPSPLEGLKNLEHVNLTGNPIPEAAIEKLKKALPNGEKVVVFEEF